jgi:hypothetical protein
VIIRNGQALGSVLHSSAPRAKAAPKARRETPKAVKESEPKDLKPSEDVS